MDDKELDRLYRKFRRSSVAKKAPERKKSTSEKKAYVERKGVKEHTKEIAKAIEEVTRGEEEAN